MKYIYSVLASFCLIVAPLQEVSASHAMGAEITFKHTSGTNFQIRMRYWRFLSGIPALNTQQVVFHTPQPSNGPTIPNVTITQMSSVIISQNMIQ